MFIVVSILLAVCVCLAVWIANLYDDLRDYEVKNENQATIIRQLCEEVPHRGKGGRFIPKVQHEDE